MRATKLRRDALWTQTRRHERRLAAAVSPAFTRVGSAAIGALITLMPYLLGYGSLAAGLACGAAGLLIAVAAS
ncbi:MAG: hypothetical protein JO236_07050 [Mycobacterium sp.]|uniref:hypothetical protein n=1 Tax=Mycobacterium sp. TaxID=1785 RepID=UPI001ECABE87|nr:hypothetical protein [Mycobacterium sp.]MBW0017284.1 hypothetical protein [Mycobacterium sp.]